jgi:hypothetical protein
VFQTELAAYGVNDVAHSRPLTNAVLAVVTPGGALTAGAAEIGAVLPGAPAAPDGAGAPGCVTGITDWGAILWAPPPPPHAAKATINRNGDKRLVPADIPHGHRPRLYRKTYILRNSLRMRRASERRFKCTHFLYDCSYCKLAHEV